jgi:hypothetical protein
MGKKQYITPGIEKIMLDNTISLLMESPPPGNNDPDIRSGSESKSPGSEQFASPFGDKPFG